MLGTVCVTTCMYSVYASFSVLHNGMKVYRYSQGKTLQWLKTKVSDGCNGEGGLNKPCTEQVLVTYLNIHKWIRPWINERFCTDINVCVQSYQ